MTQALNKATTEEDEVLLRLREALATVERDSTVGINRILAETSAICEASSRVTTRATLTEKRTALTLAAAEGLVGKGR